MQHPQLDERLSAAADFVRPGARVADIGTDHAHLIVRLVLTGVCPGGLACDVNAEPLERARSTIEAYGLERQIHTVLTDGLRGIDPRAADDVVIAGMGGDLIWRILRESGWNDTEKRYILQPMTRAPELREALLGGGYTILQERAAVAGSFCYSVMLVQYTGERRNASPVYRLVGELASAPDDRAAEYIRRQAKRLQDQIDGLSQAAEPAVRLRAQSLAALRRELLQLIGEEVSV